MAIYTKKGDKGKTSVFKNPGKKISKNSVLTSAIGTVDELDSFLGVAVSISENQEVKRQIKEVQNNLLRIGSILAGSPLKFTEKETTKLEKSIDEMDKILPKLRNFIVPGGTKLSAHLHFARCLTRRCEREVVRVDESTKISPNILKYLNRLSDYFFVLARFVNFKNNVAEEIWLGRVLK